MAVNVQGLQNKHLHVLNLMTKYKTPIAILSEVETTHGKAATSHMDGYRAFCPPSTVTGPPEKEVGVLMLISDNLATSAKPRPDINCKDTVQTVWVEFTELNLLVGGVYRRCRTGQPDLENEEFDQLTSQILRAVSTGLKMLLIGDTNLDHCNPNHRRAVEASIFMKFIDMASMRHLPTGPTWRSHGLFKNCVCSDTVCDCPRLPRTSTIDNAFCSISANAKIRLLNDTIADHAPMLVDMEFSLSKTTVLETKWIRDLRKVSSSDFEAALECFDWSQIYLMSDPDEAALFLIKNVSSALEKVAPLKLIKFRPDKAPLNLKKDTLRVMSLRDAARLSNDRQKFKALRNRANKLIKRDKILSVHARLNKNPGPKQVWQEAKNILGKGRGANKLPNVTTNLDPKDTANHQNKFFIEKIANLVKGLNTETETPHETMETQQPIMDKFKFNFVNAGSIAKIIKGLKNTSAEGIDKIPTAAWKLGVEILAGPVAKTINLSLSTGKVPKLFKNALIHPVYKGGGKDPRSPGSYRPIAILPALSKILETVVRDSLLDWLELHKILPESQWGFRPGRSVAMALACSQADWIAAKNRGEAVAIIAYDLSAAFDTIAIGPLTQKLKNAGVVGTPLKWMESYMTGRSQSVIWNNSNSVPLELTHGVPQGSILGPLLFLVMVADLPRYVTHGISSDVTAKMTCYADDSTLYVSSKNTASLLLELERMSARMLAYCKETCLVINSDKTQLLVSGVKNKNFSVKVGNCNVSPSKELNLLGITYDTNFTTVPYLRQLANDVKTRSAIISRLSYSVPPHLLKVFTNGLLLGKIMAAAPAVIPFRIDHNDKGTNSLTEKINCAIKSVARTITRTRLTDKIRSDIILQKAGLRSLNAMVAYSSAVMIWKSKKCMDPLGSLIFPSKVINPSRNIITRSDTSSAVKVPVPGNGNAAANLLARTWNEAAQVQAATNLSAAKSAARMWAQSLQFNS